MNIYDNITISKELKNKLELEKKDFITTRSAKLSEKKATEILEKINQKFKLNATEEALTVVSILFQQGGTARSCDSNMSIRIFDKDFKLADIRKCIKEVTHPKSERKLARTLANQIHEIATIMELPGNLYQKIQKQNLGRNFTISEKAWLSDFQSGNENCPTELRDLILNTFRTRTTTQKKK